MVLRQLIIILFVSSLMLGCSNYTVLPPHPDDPAYAPTAAPALGNLPNYTGSIYQTDYGLDSLYTDLRAYKVGDIITVLLSEATTANKNANTSTDKTTNVSIATPTIYGFSPTDGSVALSSANSFKGDGASKQNNSLQGSISVTVASVQPNGNLVIRGEKWITLNQGSEFIRLSGIIRPYDIDANNNISSTKISNPRITYSGTGALAEANAEGWLGRFFNGPIVPY